MCEITLVSTWCQVQCKQKLSIFFMMWIFHYGAKLETVLKSYSVLFLVLERCTCALKSWITFSYNWWIYDRIDYSGWIKTWITSIENRELHHIVSILESYWVLWLHWLSNGKGWMTLSEDEELNCIQSRTRHNTLIINILSASNQNRRLHHIESR